MAKVGSYINRVQHVFDPKPALSTSFGGATVAINLNNGSAVFRGHLEGIFLYVDTIASSAAKLTVRLTSDVAGDECIVPDTEATMSLGKSTATDGTAVYKVDLDWVNAATSPTGDTVYPWVKTDAGSCNLAKLIITWRE